MKRIALIFCAVASAVQADHELDDRDLVAGRALYTETCAARHGVDLEGQPDWRTPGENGVLPAPPHGATGHTWHHDNALLFDYTKLGRNAALTARSVEDFNSGMSAFDEGISDEEIWNILANIRSTWPP